ncbi:uncharacterized protein METZ01_LOCUS251047 [marine metagenome]|uniref:Uncharacterized protein n=1 Tax=marine metagenome TaxID=408172 RepID=A0A382IH21_9ZZZZ
MLYILSKYMVSNLTEISLSTPVDRVHRY